MLAIHRTVEEHPGAEIPRESCEPVPLPRRRKEHVAACEWSGGVLEPERPAAGSNHIDLIAVMRRLLVATLWRIQFYGQRSMAEVLHEWTAGTGQMPPGVAETESMDKRVSLTHGLMGMLSSIFEKDYRELTLIEAQYKSHSRRFAVNIGILAANALESQFLLQELLRALRSGNFKVYLR